MDNPSDEHLLALGRITAAAGHLEGAVYMLATAIVDPDQEVVDVLVGRGSFQNRLDVVAGLVKIKRGTWTEFEQWDQLVRKAMADRNLLLHGEWVAFPGDIASGVAPALFSRKRNGGYLFTEHPNADALEGVATSLRNLAAQAEVFYAEIVRWGGSFEMDADGGWVPIIPSYGRTDPA